MGDRRGPNTELGGGEGGDSPTMDVDDVMNVKGLS